MVSGDLPNKSDMDYSGGILGNTWIRRLLSGDPDRFHTDMRHVDIGAGVELSAVCWGAPVEMDTDALYTRYVVTVPLAGMITVNDGGEDIAADTGRAVIIDPERDTEQHWSADAGAIWLHLSREVVEDEARHIVRAGEGGVTLPERRPVRLEPSLDLTRGDGQRWRATLQRLIDLLDERRAGVIPPHRLAVLRREVINGLLRAAWRT